MVIKSSNKSVLNKIPDGDKVLINLCLTRFLYGDKVFSKDANKSVLNKIPVW